KAAESMDSKVLASYSYYDVLIFKGKLYLYWGPVPALCIFPIKLMFENVKISDRVITIVFAVVRFIFISLILLHLFNGSIHDHPRWLIIGFWVMAAFATPLPNLITRPV